MRLRSASLWRRGPTHPTAINESARETDQLQPEPRHHIVLCYCSSAHLKKKKKKGFSPTRDSHWRVQWETAAVLKGPTNHCSFSGAGVVVVVVVVLCRSGLHCWGGSRESCTALSLSKSDWGGWGEGECVSKLLPRQRRTTCVLAPRAFYSSAPPHPLPLPSSLLPAPPSLPPSPAVSYTPWVSHPPPCTHPHPDPCTESSLCRRLFPQTL